MKHSHLRSRFARGFTLVELLVVIAIIGILATTGLTQLGSARAKARDARRISDIREIAQVIEFYNNSEDDGYPADITAGTLDAYISGNVVPTDPATGDPYNYATSVGAPRRYYHLWIELEAYSRVLESDADIDSETLTEWTGDTIDASDSAITEACTTADNDCVYDVGQKL
ncbi:MAG: type II secretion system protein [Candidatus Paceibacterota bacterium]|nr:MAG: type II secretion system protein [Candidatus Paceibacterota bacterium]